MVKYVDSGLDDMNGNDGVFSASKYGNYAYSSLGASNSNNINNNINSSKSSNGNNGNNKKKSIKKGFKVDRRANF